MILGGDLGGTKTLLALAEPEGERLHIVRQQRYESQAYASFDAVLADFLADRPHIDTACFGLAGPTDGHAAQLTYLPWQLRSSNLQSQFNIREVRLLNDFAAAAHGLPHVDPANLHTLHAGQPVDQAPRVILGAGTGLGVAGLVWENGHYRIIPGEGGHFGFSPQTAQQGELWAWLQARNGRVTTEDIVSGPGLGKIYAFLGGRPQQPETIGTAALKGSDPLALAALDLWLACYGAFAGDLAMHWLARGGVYLAGGIAAKLLPQIDCTPLVETFMAKREHTGLVKNMPFYLLTAEDLGLQGALAFAAQM